MEMKRFLIFCICILMVDANEKTISIDLSSQKLTAKENGKIYFSADISSGMYGYQTPIGEFKVFAKHAVHKSTEYPKRDDGEDGGASMPYTMKITKNGIAIHEGKIRRENGLAVPSSHGCIRVSNKVAKKLFTWTNLHTKVFITGKTRYTDSHNKRFKEEDSLYAKKPMRYSNAYGDWSETSGSTGALVYDESFAESDFY